MKKEIIFYITLCFFLFLSSNFIPTDSIEVEWQIGDIHTYGIHFSEYVNEVYYQTSPNYEYDFSDEWSRNFNITAINYEEKIVTTDFWTGNDSGIKWDHHYSMDEKIVNDLTSITGLFRFNYEYDEVLDQVFLSFIWNNFDEPEIFLEPDWEKYNNVIKNDVLNESTIIDEVYAWGKMNQITFGEFLNNLTSYKINGKSSISSARSAFTSNNKYLSFYFDLRGIWKKGIHEIIKATLEVIIDYFDNGILKKFEFIFNAETNDDWSSFEQIFEFIIAHGGVESIYLGYTIPMIFPVILIVALLITMKRKKVRLKP